MAVRFVRYCNLVCFPPGAIHFNTNELLSKTSLILLKKRKYSCGYFLPNKSNHIISFENNFTLSCNSYRLKSYNNTKLDESDIGIDDLVTSAGKNQGLFEKNSKNKSIVEINCYVSTLLNKEAISDDEWDKLKNLLLNAGRILRVTNSNIETMMIKCVSLYDNLSLGRSCFAYLKKNIKILNPVTIAHYLKLINRCWNDHIPEDINTIDNLCNELLTKPILEMKTCQALICGLCLTNRWKESLKVIEKFKEYYPLTISCYEPIVKASFKNGEFDLGIRLLEEKMLDSDISFRHTVYEDWLKYSVEKKSGLNNMISFLSKYNIVLYENVARKILSQVLTLQNNFKSTEKLASITTITPKGACRHCQNTLKPGGLSTDEFNKLRSVFVDSLIIGKDIFLKSNPKELEVFLEFLKKTAPFDFVLDGLNVAYSGLNKYSSVSQANMLKTVTQYFVRKNKKVLIIGRKHMKFWPKEIIRYIEQNASLFLMEDLSQDDPYLLYATLFSGINTNFVSRDLMRGHKYLLSLKDREMNNIFWRWQTSHQYILIYAFKNGNCILQEPVKHLQSAQYIDIGNGIGRWHIPCKPLDDSYVLGHKKINYRSWLCLPTL